jgi:para-nitrobenzyl esterase
MDGPYRMIRRGCSRGKFHHVALIAGTNADEGTLLGGPPVRNLAQFRKWASSKVGQRADALLALYPAATDAEAHAAAAHASGDLVFLYGTRSVLRAASKMKPNAFQYQFTRLNGVGRRIQWGAFHASEIGYVFETLPDSVFGTGPMLFGDFSVDADTYNGEDTKLSTAMSGAWVAFAKTGSPNGPGLTHWPAFAADKESYLEFGDRIVPKEALRKKQIDFISDFTEGLRGQAVTRAAVSPR